MPALLPLIARQTSLPLCQRCLAPPPAAALRCQHSQPGAGAHCCARQAHATGCPPRAPLLHLCSTGTGAGLAGSLAGSLAGASGAGGRGGAGAGAGADAAGASTGEGAVAPQGGSHAALPWRPHSHVALGCWQADPLEHRVVGSQVSHCSNVSDAGGVRGGWGGTAAAASAATTAAAASGSSQGGNAMAQGRQQQR